ncbi:MAG: 4Fe-4S ferredoxin, iron-sulfur binding [Acidimicrobiaceae bacterium]|nr:4Fe-4S ferredoxin, iron-sulfur binding [Acidimicrobiaceae bacterium]
MPTALVVGSGPAAAGAAVALSVRPDLKITVIDLGEHLEEDRALVRAGLAGSRPEEWRPDDVALLSHQPVATSVRGLPEKRAYGSDFPFRDGGQLQGLSPFEDVQSALVSGAYGGFSNVWGSQLMPFSRETLAAWPVSFDEMLPHYRAMLAQVPLAGEDDDLAERFPLIAPTSALPPVSDRTARVLANYARHRAPLARMGVTVGKARLAFRAHDCVLCGLCMTGCPYGLIYSASQTFDALRQSGRVEYHSGLLAVSVEEGADGVTIRARERATGTIQTFQGDRAFLGCGAIGTTRLVLGSLGLHEREVSLGESVQFTLPMLSARATRDPRSEPQFTLNQFNMLIALGDGGRDLSQLHFYTYNPAFVDALPAPLRAPALAAVQTELLRRTSVALGYLPSWASPRLRVRSHPGRHGELAELEIRRDQTHWPRNKMLRQVLGRVALAGRHLDLYPVLPRLVLAAGGKSYHFGGSFPLRAGGHTSTADRCSSDRMGRVAPWQRVHLVDASVFPDVPATTFTFTIMANAHRIATESLGQPW